MARNDSLNRDGSDHRRHRQAGQPQAEPDRQFVHADAESERDDGGAGGGGQAHRHVVVVVIVAGADQYPPAKSNHRGRRRVVGRVADQPGQAATRGEPG